MSAFLVSFLCFILFILCCVGVPLPRFILSAVRLAAPDKMQQWLPLMWPLCTGSKWQPPRLKENLSSLLPYARKTAIINKIHSLSCPGALSKIKRIIRGFHGD
jgi:hypothetical protein